MLHISKIVNFHQFLIELFFMFDKSLKSVEEVSQIIRSAYKDGIDQETFAAKLDHVSQKILHLKEQI